MNFKGRAIKTVKKLCKNLKFLRVSKFKKLMIASLSELHDHLADGLIIVELFVGLVHRHTDRPGAWQARGGQAASGKRNLVRVI